MMDSTSAFFILKRAIPGARVDGAGEEEAAASGDGAGVEGNSSWTFAEACVGGLSFLTAGCTISSKGKDTLVSFLEARKVGGVERFR